ncbi:MAG: hypothetical protein QW561_03340 [Candidatus Aenigmatarchaeota archaeon]
MRIVFAVIVVLGLVVNAFATDISSIRKEVQDMISIMQKKYACTVMEELPGGVILRCEQHVADFPGTVCVKYQDRGKTLPLTFPFSPDDPDCIEGIVREGSTIRYTTPIWCVSRDTGRIIYSYQVAQKEYGTKVVVLYDDSRLIVATNRDFYVLDPYTTAPTWQNAKVMLGTTLVNGREYYFCGRYPICDFRNAVKLSPGTKSYAHYLLSRKPKDKCVPPAEVAEDYRRYMQPKDFNLRVGKKDNSMLIMTDDIEVSIDSGRITITKFPFETDQDLMGFVTWVADYVFPYAIDPLGIAQEYIPDENTQHIVVTTLMLGELYHQDPDTFQDLIRAFRTKTTKTTSKTRR